jgi:hypothetical protein
MARANLKHLLEDAEMRVQGVQRRLDHQQAVAVARSQRKSRAMALVLTENSETVTRPTVRRSRSVSQPWAYAITR